MRGLLSSFIFHIIIGMLVCITFPSARLEKHEESIISLELLPIAPKTNIAASNTQPPKQPQAKPIAKKEVPKVSPQAKEITPTDPTPQKPNQQKAVALAKNNKQPPLPNKNKKKTPEEPAAKKSPTKPEKTFDSLLKDLATEGEVASENANQDKTANKSRYDANLPLSLSQKDMIRSQIARCWTVPAGGRDVKNMYVILIAELEKDGSIKTIEIKEQSSYARHNKKFHEVFVESAIRAVNKCTPLKGLPLDKYDSWQRLELYFDPKELIY